MGETSALADLLLLAEWGPRQLVAAINARLSSQGRDRLRLDPTAGYSWVRRGFRPRPPIPDIAAAVLTDRVGYAITADQLWPGRSRTASAPRSAAAGLDALTHIDDLMRELSLLTTSAPTPSSPVADACGADLTATVLDQLRSAVLVARNRAGHEHVLPEQVSLIAAHVGALRRLDDRHGGGTLSLRYVTAELRNVVDLVEYANYDVRTGRRLLAIVADLAQLLGWLHFDSSRYGSAERYLLLSIGVCRALAAHDRAANAIGMLSYVSAFAGHGHQAVRLAEAAAAEDRRTDPVLRARLLGRDATAAAADGDLARFRRCADRATMLLESGRNPDSTSFLYYLSPMQLAAESGQGLVVLAERTTANRDRLLDEGIDLLADSVASMITPVERPPYARSGLLHLTFLARAHLLRGNLPEAVAVMRTGLELLPQVQSPRGRNYLRRLRPILARRARSSTVADFLPEFDTALSTV
ncbi:hypothetical protein [Salinispora arenicola]|uniref:hypothetical protein n=1 Tax=Salinispora arenicola TaxID=168697 RepID=UPI00035F23BD|nr:hypothetical protein [Salinispora arenicola]NIL57891.1 hypothetical protein [Salinispora arenicola]NIL63988.1 hypothetical protein [Salinispora arenicola]